MPNCQQASNCRNRAPMSCPNPTNNCNPCNPCPQPNSFIKAMLEQFIQYENYTCLPVIVTFCLKEGPCNTIGPVNIVSIEKDYVITQDCNTSEMIYVHIPQIASMIFERCNPVTKFIDCTLNLNTGTCCHPWCGDLFCLNHSYAFDITCGTCPALPVMKVTKIGKCGVVVEDSAQVVILPYSSIVAFKPQ